MYFKKVIEDRGDEGSSSGIQWEEDSDTEEAQDLKVARRNTGIGGGSGGMGGKPRSSEPWPESMPQSPSSRW